MTTGLEVGVPLSAGQVSVAVLSIGETSLDGREVISEPYSSQDLMASVLKSLDIPLDTTFRAKNGRPMKIANGGQVISWSMQLKPVYAVKKCKTS